MLTQCLLIVTVAVDFAVATAQLATVAIVEMIDGLPLTALTGLIDIVVIKYVAVPLVGTDVAVVKFDQGNTRINVSV